ADTDAYMRSEMLSYSRSRGAFAGVSLEGSTLRPDEDANHRLYGNDASAAKIITEPKSDTPPAGKTLVSRLQQASPHLKPSSTHTNSLHQAGRIKPRLFTTVCSRELCCRELR